MKTLLLMRHAKSDWNATFDHDFDRPLNPRGTEAAKRMGRLLREAAEVPELVFTSSARRAVDTVRLASEAGEWGVPVEELDAFYHPEVPGVLEVIRQASEDVGVLMAVGHEPAWGQLLTGLIGGGQIPFPTAAVARIDLRGEGWPDVDLGSGELRWLVTPRFMEKVEDPTKRRRRRRW